MIKHIALPSALALGMALSLGACSKSKGDELLGEFASLKNEMCKCADAACADKVHDKMNKLEEKLAATWKSKKDVPKDLFEKFDKLDDEYDSCRDKLRGDD